MILNFGLGIQRIDLEDIGKSYPKIKLLSKNGRIKVMYEVQELTKSTLLTDSGEI